MTEGDGGVKKNVGDELDESQAHERGRGKKEATRKVEEVTERVGREGSGGVKDNVRDEQEESQRK